MDERPDLSRNTWLRPAAVLGSVIPAVIAGSACQIGDGPFRITRIQFDNDSTITLTFSEPLAGVDGVDPNDFRLSFARTYSVTYTYEGITYSYAYTSYRDVSDLVGYGYYDQRFTFMSLAEGAANQIVLQTSDPLGPDACDIVDEVRESFEMYAEYYGADASIDVALFLHYAGGDVPIESGAGEPLGDIGADWVTSQDLSRQREGYGFTMLSPQLRIPCPP